MTAALKLSVPKTMLTDFEEGRIDAGFFNQCLANAVFRTRPDVDGVYVDEGFVFLKDEEQVTRYRLEIETEDEE